MIKRKLTLSLTEQAAVPPVIDPDLTLDGAELDAAIDELATFVAPYLVELKRLQRRRAAKVAQAASAAAKAARLPPETVRQGREAFSAIRGSVEHLRRVHKVSASTIHRKLRATKPVQTGPAL